MDLLRVGIIGCGGIARAHAKGYLELPSIKLVAAADINPKALRSFKEEFQVGSTYADFGRMLEKEKLDVVSVCTWAQYHAAATIRAAKSGVKAILCEKPMATNLGEADRMLSVCKEKGVKLAIAHQHRFDPVNTLAKRLVTQGAIGSPILLHQRTDGGLLNNGSHAIDTARYWLSDPEAEWVIGQVERKTNRHERGIKIEDLCVGLVCFRGGTRLVVEVDTPAIESKGKFCDAYIFGSEGTIGLAENEIFLHSAGEKGWKKIEAKGETNQFAELLDWVEGKRSHRCEAGKIRGTMEIMMAIYESARSRGLVKLPLKTRESPLELMIKSGQLPLEKRRKYDIRLPKELWRSVLA
ncbi:MAG: Gfo/Idh/MocA family oxidoreductase [Candidatus Hadarchaeum sp.]